MKKLPILIAFAIVALMLTNILSAIATTQTTNPTTIKVYLDTRKDGQATFTSEKTHTASISAKLVIPSNASEGSCAYAAHQINKTLNFIETFSIYTAYTTALPRFFITLDKDNDTVIDSILLSNYQNASNGAWKSTTGGNKWAESDYGLTSIGSTWASLDSWKTVYGNMTVDYVGVCLEREAVSPDGLDQPLYVDKLVLNGVYLTIVEGVGSPNVSTSGNSTQPTPLPTQTPTPTPKPALKPAASLNLTCSSSITQSGFKVEIKGNLEGNGTGLSGEPISLYYSLSRGNTWNELTYLNTNQDGSFSALWLPTATGNLLIKAIFPGNNLYCATKNIVNIAITMADEEEESVFSVSSNSTLSELFFNSNSSELSFTVSGDSGTTGYVDAYIPKSLVNNASSLRVYLDDEEIEYSIASQDDSWLLHFTYHHSLHSVDLTFNSVVTRNDENPIDNWVLIEGIAITATIAIIVAAIAVLRRKTSSR